MPVSGGTPEAEDLPQETFVRMYERMDGCCVIRETGSLMTRDGRVLGSSEGDINVWFAARFSRRMVHSGSLFRQVPAH